MLACTAILAYAAIIQPWTLRQNTLPLVMGDVASQDLRAPYDLQYISEVRTEAARDQAEGDVAPVYALPDPSIGRARLETLNATLDQISNIRANTETSLEDKIWQLSSLEDVLLPAEMVDFLLLASTESWASIRSASQILLSEVMRTAIRSDAELEAIRSDLPFLVSLNLSEQEAQTVVALTSPFIEVNSFYSPELTEAARQAAREAVEPILQSYMEGQMIVRRGEVIAADDYEALSEFGLVRPPSRLLDYIGAAALVLVGILFTVLFYLRRQVAYLQDLRGLLVLSLLFLIFLFSARVLLPDRSVLPYIYPLPAFALLVCALFGVESGLIFSLLLAAFSAYGLTDSLGLFPYYLLSSLCGVLALGRARRVTSFLISAVAISGAGAAMVIAYRLPFFETDLIGISTLAGAAVLYGVASASMALLVQYWLAQFLGLTTPLQLLDISRPDAPLLKYFLQRAPGTYQHSLQVATMAELAAERIGADGLLTRVGALFHDVGKSANPLYFVENQPPDNINSHDDEDPQECAETIIRHVTDGLKLARKYRLPRRLQDFILEHHGTLITRYQYNRAIKAVDGDASRLDESKFRYPGPRPRSRETAILMIADGTEARARAERPRDDEALEAIVRNVIDRAQKDHQFDDSPLTQSDLGEIVDSFVATMRTTYHPRLEYPPDQPASTETPTTQRGRARKHP